VTIGSVRAATSGGGVTIVSDGIHALTLDGTGMTAANQTFNNANVASLAIANGNASGSRGYSVGTSSAGLTINLLTDLNVGIGSGTGSSLSVFGTITNTSGSAKTITFLENSTAGTSGAPNMTIASAIGAAGSAIAINNAGSSANTTVTRGVTTISGSLGANVTTVTENSSSSALTLSGANSFSGGATVTLGLLTVTSTGNLGTGNVTLADTTGVTLTLQNNNAIADSAIVTFGTNSIINLNGTASTSETIAGLFDSTTSTLFNTPGTYTMAQLNAQFGTTTTFASSAGETITIAAVPEPGSSALLVGGMGLLTAWQRRRRLA